MIPVNVQLALSFFHSRTQHDAVKIQPRFGYILFIYDWLAELQDSLVTALS